MEIVIDCTGIDSREAFHRTLSDALCFPSWYGKNLDALYDALAEVNAAVRLQGWDKAEAALGNYGKNARRVLTEAARRNGPLEVIFE